MNVYEEVAIRKFLGYGSFIEERIGLWLFYDFRSYLRFLTVSEVILRKSAEI